MPDCCKPEQIQGLYLWPWCNQRWPGRTGLSRDRQSPHFGFTQFSTHEHNEIKTAIINDRFLSIVFMITSTVTTSLDLRLLL